MTSSPSTLKMQEKSTPKILKCKYVVPGKFGKFAIGKSSLIHQTKTIQISTYNYNLLAESIDLPNFFHQMVKTSKFATFSSPNFPTIQ